jgi:hypothetical protein
MTASSKLAPRPASAEPHYPSVRRKIHDLAAAHGVVYERTPLDTLADAHARLSDSEVTLDETELLLVALRRADVIDDEGHGDLHDAYIRGDLGLS